MQNHCRVHHRWSYHWFQAFCTMQNHCKVHHGWSYHWFQAFSVLIFKTWRKMPQHSIYHLFLPNKSLAFSILGTYLIVRDTRVDLSSVSPIHTPSHLLRFAIFSVIMSDFFSSMPCKYTLYMSSRTNMRLLGNKRIENTYLSSKVVPVSSCKLIHLIP